MIEVLRAPAFATVQDGGRSGRRAAGIPPGGALDTWSLRRGNMLAGNDLGAAAIEWALTGGALRVRADARLVLTGAEAEVRLNGAPAPLEEVLWVGSGSELEIDRLRRGRLLYMCVAGGIDVPSVLGGRGTYLPGRFGGMEGRRLRAGDVLPVGAPAAVVRAGARLPTDGPAARLVGPGGAPSIAVLPGPQAGVLSEGRWSALLRRELTVDPRSDRAGYRLVGAGLGGAAAADRRSEPACVGAVQLTPDGTLIVLMPDGPTVGGYPKIAVVATADLPHLAQIEPGGRVSLRLVGADEAVAKLREQRGRTRNPGEG